MALPWWYRTAPWTGALGGLLTGVLYQLDLGSVVSTLLDLIGVGTLFASAPPLGYLVLTVAGFAFGWTLRRVQRESVRGG